MREENRIVLDRIQEEVGDNDVALAWYVYRDSDGVTQFDKVCIDLTDEVRTDRVLSEIRQTSGFRFFAKEDEGQAWLLKNDAILRRAWAHAIGMDEETGYRGVSFNE